jgi:hypothetical protein
MKLSLSTPDWTKVFKDNYRKYFVPTGAGANDTTSSGFWMRKPQSCTLLVQTVSRSDWIEEFRHSSQVYEHKPNQSYRTHLVLVNAIKLKVNMFVTTNQF